MSTKPTALPVWASQDTTLPSTGEANKQQPKTSLQTIGWDAGQIPTAEELNWQLDNICDWVQYFNDQSTANSLRFFSTDTGAANAYVCSLIPTQTVLIDGMEVTFKAANTCTGSSTLNVDSLGAYPILNGYGASTLSGEILAGSQVVLKYNSTTASWYILDNTLGLPTVPTAVPGTNTTQVASTAFVGDVETSLENAIALKASTAYVDSIFTSIGRDVVGQTSLANLQSYLGLADIILAGTGTGVLADSGYVSIPLVVGGVKRTFIIQWGNTTVTTQTEVTVTLPVAFPTAQAVSLASKGNIINMTGEYAVGCSPSGLTQIIIRNTGSTGSTYQGIFWLAIGY